MIKDLSKHHFRLTRLFDSGTHSPDASLTDEQIVFFKHNGYLSGIDVLDLAAVEVLRAELGEIIDGKFAESPFFYEYNRNESVDPTRTLFHALGAWRIAPAFHDLVFHPGLIKIFTSLLGGPVRFWHDQVFVKPANDGGVVAWHQDYSYWTRTKPIAHLTAWIALDDSDEENGCVQYVPGSHRWKLLPKVGLANKMDDIFEVLQEQQKRAFQPVPSVLKTGQASFHHSLILHGSYENRSDRPRRGVVVNVFRDGVISDSDEPLLEGVPTIPKGDKIDGQFFPLLTPKKP